MSENKNIGSDFDVFEEQVAVYENGQAVEQNTSPTRDDKGRFVSDEDEQAKKQKAARRAAGLSDEDEEQQPAADEPAEDVDEEEGESEDGVRISRTKNNRLRVEIDNELDPNHKEVFYAADETEALKKIAVAKKNATKRIEELKRKPVESTAGPASKFSGKKLSPDEDFEVLTKWQESPSEALDLLYQKRTGMTLDDFTKKVQQGERVQAVETAARSFMTTNPSFRATPKNGGLMQAYIETHGLDDTNTDDLQKAYEFLNSSGLLEAKQQKEIPAPDSDARIEHQPEPKKKKASSALFSRGGGSTTVEKTNQDGLSDKELAQLDRMSLEDQKNWFNRRLQAQRSRN
jgi:hypothetical protein